MTYTNPPHYFNLSVLSLWKMARRRTSNQIYLITFREESGKIHSIIRHLVALSLWTTLQLPHPLRSVFQALLSKAPLMRELCMVLPLKAVITVFFFFFQFSVSSELFSHVSSVAFGSARRVNLITLCSCWAEVEVVLCFEQIFLVCSGSVLISSMTHFEFLRWNLKRMFIFFPHNTYLLQCH